MLIGNRAVLIRGPAGSGKSRLALALIEAAGTGRIRFARLVADDRVELIASHGRLLVRPPATLAGLIDDQVEHGSSGIPGLSRIPVIGGLFGTQHTNKSRTETIILITPTIVRNPQEAADLTDEYSRRFRAMEPLHQPASNRK